MGASHQYQRFTKQPLHNLQAILAFPSAVALAVNTGAFPATGDKVALAAANFSKVLDANGDVTLDDANDRILLEPGVYEVELQLRFRDTGTDSDFSVALTTAAQASNDLLLTAVHGGVLSTGLVDTLNVSVVISVSAARALELHAAATTAAGGVEIRPGGRIVVRRIGNPEA